MSKKFKYDALYMRIAHDVAEMSYSKRKLVGAVAVRDGNILGHGWNGMPAGMDNNCELPNGTTNPIVLHAESNLIAKIAKSNESTMASEVYCTLAPCLDCAKQMYQCGVIRVVYANQYRSTAGIEFLESVGVEVEHLSFEVTNNEN